VEEADRVAEELQNLVPGRVIRDVKGYLRDWWPIFWISSEEEGKALVGVRPFNVEEVVKVVKYAGSKKLAIVCRGGGSSVTGASVPMGGIVLDMTGMNQVLDLDETSRTVLVQSGAKLNDLESRLGKKGFTLGQFPQSFELATVGGYISTAGTGQYSTLYGGVEDSVLRLQVVLPNGRVLWTRGRDAPRSSIGPDLARLFIGAEGVFGVILAAELKLYKLPKHTWKSAYTVQNLWDALNAAKKLLDLDVQPAVCRVYNEVESGFLYGDAKVTVILLYSFESPGVMKATTDEVRETMDLVGVPGEPSLVDTWLEKRFAVREQIDAMKKMGYTIDTVEMASKWGRVLDLYSDVMTRIGGLDGVAAVGAHLSHPYQQGACIYFTMVFKPTEQLYWTIWNTLSEIAERHDATISHHHGVGILKAGFVKKEVPRELLSALKKAIDSEGSMNPGKLI